MTFKLVGAASQVSGLPVEVCLEEFGKHFLVYCQKNGYDQILRVLGSNLFDFLTNLDNLHDHLASIYPGMRAPSFRVTRHLNGPRKESTADCLQEQRQESAGARQQQSMYLHYYSERAGLSPIVKGLVLAVAREFFQTEITVTECQTKGPLGPATSDHVVFKIDRTSAKQEQDKQRAPDDTDDVTTSRDQEPALDSDEKELSANSNATNDQSYLTQRSPMMLDIYNSLSSNEADSFIDSETMMLAFPFHVIFDRQFVIVQVGRSLLKATSQFWQRASNTSNDNNNNNSNRNNSANDNSEVKFGDLFFIQRPKIEFTFEAIAGHTNQVFVAKTRPNVLNCNKKNNNNTKASFSLPCHQKHAPTQASSVPRCPFDKIARDRLLASMNSQATGAHHSVDGLQANEQIKSTSLAPTKEEKKEAADHAPTREEAAEPKSHTTTENNTKEHISLRLKGQMIVLMGGELCLFLCSPRVDHLGQLWDSGIRMSHFALHDRARELMLMSHTHKEDREAVKKLDQATNDLKKMDAKLRLENKRTEEVLHNIFPAKIATLLSHGSKIESESFEMVTCLYSDIIGFTRMCGSENVRPIDIVVLLNTLYLQFDSLTNIHGVFKVETIGDAYVVVGGLPEPAADHADRVLRMGLGMVRVIATVRSPADQEPIQVSNWRRDYLARKSRSTKYIDHCLFSCSLASFCPGRNPIKHEPPSASPAPSSARRQTRPIFHPQQRACRVGLSLKGRQMKIPRLESSRGQASSERKFGFAARTRGRSLAKLRNWTCQTCQRESPILSSKFLSLGRVRAYRAGPII